MNARSTMSKSKTSQQSPMVNSASMKNYMQPTLAFTRPKELRYSAMKTSPMKNQGAKTTTNKVSSFVRNPFAMTIEAQNERDEQEQYSTANLGGQNSYQRSNSQSQLSYKKKGIRSQKSYGKAKKQNKIGVRPLFNQSNSSQYAHIGPGAYDGNHNVVKYRTPSALIFGYDNRSPFKNQSSSQIGPGEYNHNLLNFGKDAHQVSIKPIANEPRGHMGPGPGAYNPDVAVSRSKSPQYSIKGKSSTNARQLGGQDGYIPGPGQYDPSSFFGKDGKHFSIQGPNTQSQRISYVGPGTYNPNEKYVKEKVRNVKISQTEARTSRKEKEGPAPGSYYPQLQTFGNDAPKYTMGQRSRSREEFSPGPGHYDPIISSPTKQNQPSRISTAQPSKMEKIEEKTPGPGHYQSIDNFGKSAKKFTISSKQTPKSLSYAPGPGHYQPSTQFTKESPKKATLSNSMRGGPISKEQYLNPGPGHYITQKDFGKDAPAALLLGKVSTQKVSYGPGPGFYQPIDDQVKYKSPSVKLDNYTERLGPAISKDNLAHPGPGTYEPNQIKTTQVYSFGERRDEKIEYKPGPGQYDPDLSPTKSKSVAMKFSQLQRDLGQQQSKDRLGKSPGPGEYDLPDTKMQISYKMSEGQRMSPERRDIPGPGQYERSEERHNHLGKINPPSYTAPKEIRCPGPGDYEPKHTVVKSTIPIYSMGTRNNDKIPNLTMPGPGHYNPDESIIKAKSRSHAMSSGDARFKTVVEQQPGPGEYDHLNSIAQNSSQAYQFGNGPKISPLAKERVYSPGPGYYDPDHQNVKASAPSYNMRGSLERFDNQPKDQHPGPGHYDSPQKIGDQSSLKYTIGLRPIQKDGSYNPGPGHYEPDHSNVKASAPSFNMKGSQERFYSPSKDQLPGPGHYDNPQIIGSENSQKFKIGQKHKERDSNYNPGPGHYEPDHSNIKASAPSFKMNGQQERFSSPSMDQHPGPGHYEHPEIIGGKESITFTIGQRPLQRDGSPNPGPGHYEPDHSNIKASAASFIIKGSQERFGSPSKEQLPGPGHYDNPQIIGAESSKKFTIGQRPIERDANLNPGPGHYEPDHSNIKASTPSYNMAGQQERFVQTVKEQIPGPGHYDHAQTIGGKESKAFTIGQRTLQRDGSPNPGPGHYEPDHSNIKASSPSFRMNGLQERFSSPNKDQLPGPGHYDHPQTIGGKESKSFTIRDRLLQKDGNLNPGPGHYEPDHSNIKASAPSFNMAGQRERFASQNQDQLPGPGHYDHPQAIGGKDSKAFTIGEKPLVKDGNQNPGPGHYEPDHSNIKASVPSFNMNGSQQRFSSPPKDQAPGPGHYESPQIIGGENSKRFTIASKPVSKVGNQNPGPGHYEHSSDSLIHPKSPAPKISQSQRKPIAVIDLTSNPGPGNYDVSSSPTKVKSFRFSDLKRQNIVSRDAMVNPGPGHYENVEKIGYKSPEFKIGVRNMNHTVDQLPGPGHYAPSHDFTQMKLPAAIIHPKHQREQSQPYVPGPGHYSPDDLVIKVSIPSYKLGGQQDRFNFNPKEQLPGPGLYEYPQIIGGKDSKTFTIGEKKQQRDGNQNPGPGHYEPDHSNIKASAPSFNIKGSQERFSPSAKDQLPGPGHYENPQIIGGKDAKSFTIGQRKEERDGNYNPGPGHYEPDHSNIKASAPSFNMRGSQERFNSPNKDELPGPGHYDNQQFIGGKNSKTFTIGQRPLERDNSQNPGPGHYEPDHSNVRASSPSYRLGGTGERFGAQPKDELPGPGHYDNPQIIGGKEAKSFTIGQRPLQRDGSQNPGPGHYEPDHSNIKAAAPSFNMRGSTERFSSPNKDQLPGPGHYDHPQIIGGKDSKVFTIGEKQQQRDGSPNPGPGHYEPDHSNVKASAPSFNMAGQQERFAPSIKDQHPGPGHYDHPQVIGGKDSKTFTIGEKLQQRDSSQNPGPGHYEPDHSNVKASSPSYRLGGTEERFSSPQKHDHPGPGHYESHQGIGDQDSYKFLIGQRLLEKQSNQNPGPGHYDHNNDSIVRAKSPSVKISKTQRNFSLKESVSHPGPGNYDIQNSPTQAKGFKFSELQRPNLVSRDAIINPGPGHYKCPEKLSYKSPQFKIGVRNLSKSFDSLPGPGHYEVSHEITTTKLVATKINPLPAFKSSQSYHPGPGHYSPDHSHVRASSVSYRLGGNGERFSSPPKDNHPGPGHYDHSQVIGADNSKKFTIGQRPLEKESSQNPGPGHYDHQNHLYVKDHSYSQQFSKRQRSFSHADNKEQELLPGPGNYDLTITKNSQGFKFSQLDRPDPVTREAIVRPGPGHYEQNSSFGKIKGGRIIARSRSQFLTPSKTQLYTRDQFPGPGHYYVDHPKATYSFLIGQRLTEKPANQNPGPGHYDVPHENVKARSKVADFGKSPERETVFGDTGGIGPGAYDAKDEFLSGKHSASFTISKGERSLHKIKNFDSPGPGQYKIPVKFGAEKQFAFPVQDQTFKYV